MVNLSRFALPAFTLTLAATVLAQGGSVGIRSPFSAPAAKYQYAPDRMYDLEHVLLEFDVDYPNRAFKAKATDTVSALKDGTSELRFHASEGVKINGVTVNNTKAEYTRDGQGILVKVPPTKAGQKFTVVIDYGAKKSEGAGGGWHWHEPKKNDPSKVGFWTNGETHDTRD